MSKTCIMAGLVALGLATAGGAIDLAAGDGKPGAVRPPDGPRTAYADVAVRAESPLAEKLGRLRAGHEAAQRAYSALYRGSTIPEENRDKEVELRPDYPALVRRIFELASTAPKDPAVRDALIWMISRAGRSGRDSGSEAGEFALASSWLVRNFGDDPEAARVGLDLDGVASANRDNLILNLYASARGRESKGLARLALAQYLQRKAMAAEGARKLDGPPTITHDDIVAADGSLYTVKEVMPDSDFAYVLHLKQCDVSYLRSEAERLYEEVIADYGDVPHIRTRDRELEALLRQPEPRWNGEPLTDELRRQMETNLVRRRTTLGEVAEARLDDWHNLAVGKEAPEIAGADVEGKPLKLSDFRGRVVALVFWGSWCAPCMREVPREKALAERMKGRPFALLGVNTDADADAARRVMKDQGMTWRGWHDGHPGLGPIAGRYHVRGYPTVFVIDAAGKIRSKKAHGESLDRLVEELVDELEAAGK